MGEVGEMKLADRLAGSIRAWVDDTGFTDKSFEWKVDALRQFLGSVRLPVDLVWQMAKSPWATGTDGWAERHHDEFWRYLEALEDKNAPGIVHGTVAVCQTGREPCCEGDNEQQSCTADCACEGK